MVKLVERFCRECHRIGFINNKHKKCPKCGGKIERVNLDARTD